MGINSVIYLSEAVATVIALIVVAIFFSLKHKKGLLKFLGITLAIFVVIFGITFATERPEMEMQDNISIEVKSGVKLASPNTSYHFQNVTDKVEIKGDIDYDKAGAYEVEYEVKTLFGTYVKKAIVNVVDTTAPEIILDGEENYKLSYKKEYKEPGFKAIDKNDGDVTEKVKTEKEEIDDENYNLIYSVEDFAGNKGKSTRKVTIIDDIKPEITINGQNPMTVYVGKNYEEKGAEAKDEKDGDLTKSIKTEGEVDTSKEGKYTITYKVSDKSGNEAIETRTVNVVKYEEKTAAQSGGKKGVIYLTFDDGPSADITPKILDILKKKDVKATFFILNYDSTGEKLVQRAYNEGHTIAIHGYSHDYYEIYKSEDAYMKNLTKLQDKIKKSTGYTATLTRFPGGSSNTVSRYNPGIMTRLSKLVVEKGFKYFDWNVSSGDAGGAKSSQDVYNNVTQGLSKSKANVVLMHDFSGNTKTLNALEDIIDYGLENGYTFEPLTENTPMVTHGTNN